MGGRAEDPLSAHRPRPAPGATSVRLGKAASAERSETRSPRPRRARTGGGAGESAPTLTAVASPPPESAPTPATAAGGPRVSGLEELVHVAVSVLRLAAEASGLSGQDVERQVADTLAFLRRRLTGDYVVDEFGFDEDFTDQRLPAAAAPALPVVVPGRGPRHREHPDVRAARWSWPTTPARSRWTR